MAVPLNNSKVGNPGRGLWRHADFLKLWVAQSVSLFGSEITTLALPLMAVLLLNASAFQMGLLSALGKSPFLLLSLLAGVWIDNVHRRPVLIAADLGRAALLLSVPIAVLWGRLAMLQLYLVAFGLGILTVCFEIAHLAYVPTLVPRAQLVEGNSKIQSSYSVAESGGPGVAGLLVQAISAPLAVLADVASFIVSALLMRSIRAPEAHPQARQQYASLSDAIRVGLRALLSPPLLRVIIVASALSEVFTAALLAIYILYASQELHLSPATIGLIFGVGGLAAVPGAFLAGRVAQRCSVGYAIVGGWLLAGLAGLLIPFATGPMSVLTLMMAQAIMGAAGAIANIHQWTYRQAITPDQLLGRVTASHRFIVYGAGAIGALLGGGLGAALGLRPAILVCTLCALAGPLYAVCSPLRHLREQPTYPVTQECAQT